MGPVWYPNLLGANPQCVLPCGFPVLLDEARSVSSQEAAGTTDGTAETAAGADGGTTGYWLKLG
jgi:hypothetical protein